MNKTIIFLFGLLLFLANGDNYAAAPLIVNIAEDLHFTINAAATSVTAYMLAFGLFTILFGPLSDRYGKVFIIQFSTLGTALFSILGALAYDLPSLIFFRSINGAFAAGLLPVTFAYLGQAVDDIDRPKVFTKIMSYGFLGTATATLIGGTVAHFGSWKLVYLTYGILELILAIAMFKIMVRDKPISDKINLLSSYKIVLSHKGVLALLPLFILMGFTVFGVFTYTGQLISERFGYDIFTVGTMLSPFGLGIILAGKIIPKLQIILGQYYMLFNGIVTAIALLGLSAANNPFTFCLFLLFFGAGFILFQPVFIAKIQDQIPHMKGPIMSMASFSLFVGGAIGTTLNGFMISEWGIAITLYFSASIIFVTGFLASLVMYRLDNTFAMKMNN